MRLTRTLVQVSIVAILAGNLAAQSNQLLSSSSSSSLSSLSSRLNSHLQPSPGSLLSTAASSMSGSSSALSAPLFKDLSGPTSGKIQTLDVICGKNFMTVRAEFSGPFYGIVFSKGTYGQENCIYVKPNSGLTHAAFNVYYDQCGTKPDLQGKFYENTIVIQYGSDIIEAYDEAKRLRCEWFEAYEKPATFKPAIPVADLEVVEMNFQGDDIDCWMEIQEGTGPMSREVSKIVPVGQPMTIVVAINDYNGQFDMRVKSCVAHDGVQSPIALTDEFGCVLRPKMLTSFQKVRNPGGVHKKATILSYSRFLAFKFPDSMTVQIQCTVEVCRHGCADACQRIPSIAATTMQPELSLTAKWPAASNQAALESSPVGVALARQQADLRPMAAAAAAVPARPLYNQQQAAEQLYQAAAAAAPPPKQVSSSADGGATGDEMNGSESSQQAAAMALPEPQRQPAARQPPPQQQQHRRSQDHYQPLDGYMAPVGASAGRRLPQMPLHGARLPPSIATGAPQTIMPTTSTTTTTTSTTTTTTSTTSAPLSNESNPDGAEESNRAGGPIGAPQTDEIMSPDQAQGGAPDQSDSASRPDSSSGADQSLPPLDSGSSSSSSQKVGEQSSGAGDESQPASQDEDIKAEASQVKPIAVEAPPTQVGSEQQQQQSAPLPMEAGQLQNKAASSQGAGDESDQAAKKAAGNEQAASQKEGQQSAGAQSQSQSSASDLKTVEVEIPADEEPTRGGFISSNSQDRPNAGFNSIRLSSGGGVGDMQSNSPAPAGYDSVIFENSRFQDQRGQSESSQSIIQPRDRTSSASSGTTGDKRDKLDEANFEVASQQQQQQLGSGKMRFGARSQPQQAMVAPSQQSEVAPAANHQPRDSLEPSGESSLQSNPDRILSDRSDESSSLSELPASSSSAANNGDSLAPAGGDLMMAADKSSLASVSSKVRPVVGTDELATGPIQIEDRIGAPAPAGESLEEALSRLQRRIPLTAALVSSPNQQPVQMSPQGAEQSASKSDEQLRSNVNSAEDRADLSANRKATAQEVHKQQQQQKATNAHDINQPHPNVAGQAKVIPDPSNNLNTRSPMQTQASAIEGVVAAPNGAAQQASPSSGQNSGLISSGPTNQMQQQQQLFNKPQMIDMQQASKPVAQISNVPIGLGFAPSQLPAFQQLQQQLAQQFQQQQQQQQPQQQQPQQQQQPTTSKPSRGRFNLLSPQAALHAVASRLLPKSVQASGQQQQQQQQQQASRLPTMNQQLIPQLLSNMQQLTPEQRQQMIAQQSNYLKQQFGGATVPANQPPTQSKASGLFNRLTNSLHGSSSHNGQQAQGPIVRNRRSLPANSKGEVGVTKTFMVVTGMDLAFVPSSLNETELPQILEGRRLEASEEIIYGVCMPIVSLTFVLTCAFWLLVFLLTFCIYMLIRSRRQRQAFASTKLNAEFNYQSPEVSM